MPGPTDSAEPSIKKTPGNLTIFLADDDPEDREIFQDALRVVDNTINFFTANDGEKALVLLTGDILEKPDLIFLDLNMPRLNGRELLIKLRADASLSNTPIVMYSTFFNDGDLGEFRKAGARHLIKPPAFDQLVVALTKILATT